MCICNERYNYKHILKVKKYAATQVENRMFHTAHSGSNLPICHATLLLQLNIHNREMSHCPCNICMKFENETESKSSS